MSFVILKAVSFLGDYWPCQKKTSCQQSRSAHPQLQGNNVQGWNCCPRLHFFLTCLRSSTGSLACWHCHQLRVSEDLQPGFPPTAADQVGQIQFGHSALQWCVIATSTIMSKCEKNVRCSILMQFWSWKMQILQTWPRNWKELRWKR